jgi:hypothetical protein
MLARFLRNQVMSILIAGRKPLTFEDRIDQLGQLALVVLLLATLSGVVL